MKTFGRWVWQCVAVLGMSIIATAGWANGINEGGNYVPLLLPIAANLTEGTTVSLLPGMPIFVQTNGPSETLRTALGEYATQVPIPREALPKILDGYWMYRKGDFARAAATLAPEADSETNPIVRSWKYILAGHAYLMVDAKNLPLSSELYLRAAEAPPNPLRIYGRYYVIRALLFQKDYDKAREGLREIVQSREAGNLTGNVLFWGYPHVGRLPAQWRVPLLSMMYRLKAALDRFVEARDRAKQVDQIPGEEQRAAALYEYALAAESLWEAQGDFLESYSFDEMGIMLKPVFETYPNTWAAEQAYYGFLRAEGLLDYEHYEAEYHDWLKLRQTFRAKYPNSSLIQDIETNINRVSEAIARESRKGLPPQARRTPVLPSP